MTAGITADEASQICLSPAIEPGRRTYFPGLDGLRGIAVLLVVAVHFFPAFKMSNWVESWLAKIPENGWIGVDLFFVLSGFLITGILIDASDKPYRFRNFYMRRVLRIFPLYLGVLVVVLWFIPILTGLELPPIIRTNQAWLWFHLSNVKMVLENDYIFKTGWVDLAHLWTLAVEEHFYLVWPALIFFVPRKRWGYLALGCVALALACRITIVWLGVFSKAPYIFTLCRMDSLAIGAWIAIVASRSATGLNRLARYTPVVLTITGSILIFRIHQAGGLWVGDHFMQTVGYLVLAIFFAAMVVRAAVSSPSTWEGRLWHNKSLRTLGKYGYGMYVFHGLLIPAFNRYLPAEAFLRYIPEPFLAGSIRATAALLATFPIALLSWHLYENRFLALKKYFKYDESTPMRPAEQAA